MKGRLEAILRILRYADREVKVDELSSLLNVSEATIRRDLERLERDGKIVRTYGGALLRREPISPVLRRKMRENLREKMEIARAAVGLINNHETIILCDGTTTYQIAVLLKESSLELRVITNDLNIALELAEAEQIETIIIGGKITGHYSIGGYLGEKVVEFIHDTNSSIDKAFIGADAVDLEEGLTTFGKGDVNIVNLMARLAKEVIAVVDHTKFGKAKFIPLLPLDQVDLIITDSGIPEKVVEAYRSKGVPIIVAEPLSIQTL